MTYQLFISFYQLLFKLASLFSTKAKARVQGIKNTQLPKKSKKRIWLHCASAGEYEQCIPFIQKIKEETSTEVCVSFFSPSGAEYYQLRPYADFYFYLPFDTKSNAKKLLDDLKPDYVIWVKYDFWENIIQQIYLNKIPCDLIFTDLKHIESKTRWIRNRIRHLLPKFNHIYSITSAKSIAIPHQIIHDGKWEQSLLNTRHDFKDEIIEHFTQNKKVVVIGSAHSNDIQILVSLLKNSRHHHLQWVVVPHQIDKATIHFYQQKLKGALAYSKYDFSDSNMLIVNQMGALKYLYRYADIAWIGGGFNKSIHNALEASAYLIPLISGPNIQGMPEAEILQNKNILYTFKSSDQLEELLSSLFKLNKNNLQKTIKELYHQKSKDNYSHLILENIQSLLFASN